LAFVEERVRDIERKYARLIQDLLVLCLTEETLRLVLVLNDGVTLRVAERWQSGILVRFSYYWLNAENKLKVGWDNSPHHKRLESFPHHKHVGEQAKRVASNETCLEEVIAVLEGKLTKPR